MSDNYLIGQIKSIVTDSILNNIFKVYIRTEKKKEIKNKIEEIVNNYINNHDMDINTNPDFEGMRQYINNKAQIIWDICFNYDQELISSKKEVMVQDLCEIEKSKDNEKSIRKLIDLLFDVTLEGMRYLLENKDKLMIAETIKGVNCNSDKNTKEIMQKIDETKEIANKAKEIAEENNKILNENNNNTKAEKPKKLEAIKIGIENCKRIGFNLHEITNGKMISFTDKYFEKADLKESKSYKNDILPELDMFFKKYLNGKDVFHVYLDVYIPLGFLVGYYIGPDGKNGATIYPMQYGIPWNYDKNDKNDYDKIKKEKKEKINDNCEDIALCIMMTRGNNVYQAVPEYINENGIKIKCILYCSLESGMVVNGTHAKKLCNEIIDYVTKIRNESNLRGVTHIFAAIPIAIAFILGQYLKTLGTCEIYNFDMDKKMYTQTISIPPQ